jgi:type IV pilus assembly protein PilN
MGGGAGAANYNGVLLVGLLVAGLLAGGAYWFFKKNALQEKQAEVAARREEAQKLESIIKEVEDFQRRKDSLEKRIALINDLKRNQKNPVKIMDRISQDVPDLVWLDSMDLDGLALKITGRALNPNAVSNFIANIKADPLFEEPSFNSLTQDKSVPGVNVYQYSMTVKLKAPPPPPAAGAAPGAAQPAPSGSATGV